MIYNKANQGLTFRFSPVKARYVRVTGDTVGNGSNLGYTTLGEIQLFAAEGNLVYTDTLDTAKDGKAKLYAAEEGAKTITPSTAALRRRDRLCMKTAFPSTVRSK